MMKRTFNNSRTAYHLYKNRRSLIPMLRDVFSGNYRLSLFTFLALIAGLIYAISPADLLPDFIPVVGWLDDGLVLYFVLKQLRKELVRYAIYKNA